jgi:hypothetical protein
MANGHTVEHGSLKARIAAVDDFDRGQCLCCKGRWQHDVLHVQTARLVVDRGIRFGVDVDGRRPVDRPLALALAGAAAWAAALGVNARICMTLTVNREMAIS